MKTVLKLEGVTLLLDEILNVLTIWSKLNVKSFLCLLKVGGYLQAKYPIGEGLMMYVLDLQRKFKKF